MFRRTVVAKNCSMRTTNIGVTTSHLACRQKKNIGMTFQAPSCALNHLNHPSSSRSWSFCSESEYSLKYYLLISLPQVGSPTLIELPGPRLLVAPQQVGVAISDPSQVVFLLTHLEVSYKVIFCTFVYFSPRAWKAPMCLQGTTGPSLFPLLACLCPLVAGL